MFRKIFYWRKLRKLNIFVQRFSAFQNDNYKKLKVHHIDTIRWLIAYYEGRASATPKQLLEDTLINENITIEVRLIKARVLYFWIYQGRIEGF